MARGFKQSVKKSLEIYTYLNSFNLVSPFTRSSGETREMVLHRLKGKLLYPIS